MLFHWLVGCKRLYGISHNYVDDRDWTEGETGKTIRNLVAAVFNFLWILQVVNSLQPT